MRPKLQPGLCNVLVKMADEGWWCLGTLMEGIDIVDEIVVEILYAKTLQPITLYIKVI